MNINISYTGEKPMYEQIKESIKRTILNGEFCNNALLPSVRQLAKDLNVSMITTKRAYTELELEGFIYTVSGKGTFIKLENLENAKESGKMKLLDDLKQQFSEIKSAGIPRQDIENLLDSTYGKDDNDE